MSPELVVISPLVEVIFPLVVDSADPSPRATSAPLLNVTFPEKSDVPLRSRAVPVIVVPVTVPEQFMLSCLITVVPEPSVVCTVKVGSLESESSTVISAPLVVPVNVGPAIGA